MKFPEGMSPSRAVRLISVKGMMSVPLVSGVDESTVTMKLVNRAAKILARLAEASILMLFGVPATGVPSPTFVAETLWVTVVMPAAAPTLILTSAGGPHPSNMILACARG